MLNSSLQDLAVTRTPPYQYDTHLSLAQHICGNGRGVCTKELAKYIKKL